MLSNNPGKLKLNLTILGTSVVVAAIIPFVLNIVKEVPIISLCLGQMALIFLMVLAAFPKANYQDIVRVSTNHLIFLVIAFTILSFLPLATGHKLFHFKEFEGWIPSMVSTNLLSLVFLNIAAFVYLSLNFVDEENDEIHEVFKQTPPASYTQELQTATPTKLEELNIPQALDLQSPPPGVYQTQSQKFAQAHEDNHNAADETLQADSKSSELREAVDNLFDIYLDDDDFESEEVYNDTKLEKLENTLLDNLDYSIDGALCLNTEGQQLDETVFKWDGPERDELITVFSAYNEASKESGTGRLCQFLLNEAGFWYMVARYRGNFLVLKAELEEPSPLLETAYKVFRAISAEETQSSSAS